MYINSIWKLELPANQLIWKVPEKRAVNAAKTQTEAESSCQESSDDGN